MSAEMLSFAGCIIKSSKYREDTVGNHNGQKVNNKIHSEFDCRTDIDVAIAVEASMVLDSRLTSLLDSASNSISCLSQRRILL